MLVDHNLSYKLSELTFRKPIIDDKFAKGIVRPKNFRFENDVDIRTVTSLLFFKEVNP